MIKKPSRQETRQKRHLRARKKISGTSKRPRLSVFRSGKQIYVQFVDDSHSATVVSASSLDKEIKVPKAAPAAAAQVQPAKAEPTQGAKEGKKKELSQGKAEPKVPHVSRPLLVAKAVGALAAKRALEKGITEVVFDRDGFKYHGRVKALADGAREAGLKF